MKNVFITGGNGDIGGSIVNIFSSNGYNVIYPSSKELDLKNINDIDKYFERYGINYDVIIHCAGINNINNIEDLNINDIYSAFQINTVSFFQILKNVLPYQKNNGGHILGISSLYGNISRGGRLPYAMSKHALVALVQTAAIELAQYNILINALSPGFVYTEMTKKNNSKERIKYLESGIPLGKLADVSDIAKTAYFLCSSENTYITGQDIIVDGGFMCGGFQR